MKKNILILTSLFFSVEFIHSQVDDTKFQPMVLQTAKEMYKYNFFEPDCKEVTDSLNKLEIEKEIGALILNSSQGNIKTSNIKLEDNWQLLSLYEIYRNETIGVGSIFEKSSKCFITDSLSTNYSTIHLFNLFEISDSTFGKECPLTELPKVYERTDLYNGKWTITYFVIRKDGNIIHPIH